MGELRYLSDDAGFTIVSAPPALVLLPLGAAHLADRVRAEASRPDATLERVVSSIPTQRDGVESFLVLWLPVSDDGLGEAEGALTAVARGSLAADVRSPGGTRRFGSLGALPWRMATFDDVSSVVAGALPPLPESPPTVPGEARPLGTAVVAGHAVYWIAAERAHPPERRAPSAAASAVGSAPRARGAHDGGDTDDTVLTRTSPRRGAHATSGSPGPDQPGSGPAPRVRFAVTHPAGEVELDRPVLVGRRPTPRPGMRPAAGPVPHLVPVPSPTGVVSATHVEIAPAGRAAVVTDLRSTNGTVVTFPDGGRVRLRQGDSVAVAASARVDIGDGVVLRIHSADAPSTEHEPPDTTNPPQEYRP